MEGLIQGSFIQTNFLFSPSHCHLTSSRDDAQLITQPPSLFGENFKLNQCFLVCFSICDYSLLVLVGGG